MKASEIYRAVQNYTELTFRLSDNDLDREWSWNDYGEGTVIEPSIASEYRYLEHVQKNTKARSFFD